MGFLSNLIGNIKNNFSDDKGLFQKNKFVGFGGANDYAKSQLDLGNSNIPLSSTQQPTYQQFKPQMETPVAQPSLNTTSSIDTLKNRIKSIQGLTPIKVKDPVPQIQPQPTPIIDRVKQVTSNVMGGINQLGNNIKKGITDQVDIQKRDFKDYVVDPLFNRPGENLGEGTFGGTVYRDLVKPVGRWAQTTGEELVGKTNRDLDELIANNEVKQKILDNKVNIYTQLVNSGQKNSPQAIRLREEIITGINQDSGFKKFQEDTLNKENQYKSDAIKTGMTVAGAGAAASNPMALMLPTAIGGAIGVAGGKDLGEATGEAFSNAVRWKSVTQFTDPAIGMTVNQFVKSSFAPIARQLTTRLISGTGNVIEDRIIDGLENKQRGIWDDVVSFGIGALMSNGGKGVSNWSNWKKDFSKNWTKDVSDSFKLDPNDSKLVEQTVGSMLDKVNKYMTSPEGMKMQEGFIRIPFGPDAEVKPDTPKVDMANQSKDADTALELFEIAKKEGITDEKFLRERLKINGYDISKITIKGEPTQISSIFDKYKVPEKPIDLVVSGQKVPVEQLKAEGWNENQINQAMKELDKDGSVPPEKIDSWIRKKLSDLYPKSAEKIKSGRKLPLPPEPTDSELVKMDRNASEILETPIKTEPKTSKVTTQEKIVNPSGSSEVVKAKPISDLGSKSKPISEIKPKTETIIRNVPTPDGMETKFEEVPIKETPKVETEKVETPKTKVDDKFAGDKARLKYKNIDATTIINKKLASAVANAKKLDEWEVNKNAIKSKVADNAWKKVSMIENGTWKEEKITVETIDRDTKEGTDALNKLIGKINQSETQSFDFASRSGLTDIKSQDTEKIINAIENTKAEGDEYSPEDIANIQKTKDFWKRALAIGKKLGLNIKETKNYFTHMYAEFQGSNMSGSKNLSQKTPFANSRKYSSYKEAFEKAGLTRAFNNISEFGTRYMQKNLTTKAKIDFLASLPFKNIEDIKDLGDDYKIVNKIKGVDIGENDRYLPAKLADMVNGYFGDENAFKSLEKASKVAKFFQNIKLNAGIPFTPANYYGIVQGFKEFTTELGQMVMGKKSPLQIHTFKNFARSFSRDNSIKWEKDNIKSIIKMKSVFRIDGEYNLKGLLEGGFWDSVKDKKYGEAINKAMGDATFKRFMFQNMVSSFKESEAKFVKSGMDEKTATKTALTLIEKLYGLQRVQAKYTGSGLEKILGNKNVSNALQTLLMAKDYKQQMSKMWWNMAKAIKNPGAPENQGVVAYGIGIALTKAAMETANYITTGKLMEENPENLKDKAVIGLPGSKSGLTLQSVPGTGFVPKTLFRMGKSSVTGKGDVGKQAGSFLSIPLGLGVDLANNEDYFGNNIWDSSDTTGEKAKKVAGYSAKEVISPYVTGAKSLMSILNKKKNGDMEDIKDSEINDILKAIEFPMSYVSKDRFETLHFYDTKKEQYNKLTEDEKVIFDKIEKKGTDFGSKQRDAVADAQDFVNYPAVLNAKKEIAIETAKKNGTEVDPLYKLTDAQLKTYYQIQGLRNNRYAQKALKDENEWYNELSGERSKYFDDLVASGKMKAQESDYPKASPEVQKKIDYLTALKTPELKKKQDYYYTLPKGTGARSAYIKANPDLLNYWNTKNAYNEANPDIQAFWDEVNAYNVKVDEAFGIKPEEDTTSSGSSGYGGWQNWEKADPNVYTFLNKITGKVDSTLKKDINSIIKLSKKDKSSKELTTLINKTYKSLSEIFGRTKK